MRSMYQARNDLAVELASGKVGKSLQLTRDQQGLGSSISTSLLYIVGLLLYPSSSSSSSRPQSSPISISNPSQFMVDFSNLRKIYNDTILSKRNNMSETEEEEMKGKEGEESAKVQVVPQIFHLSPRLLPTPDQQRIVDEDVAFKIKEMEDKANRMADELLQKEMKINFKSKSKKDMKQKRAPIRTTNKAKKQQMQVQARKAAAAATASIEPEMSVHNEGIKVKNEDLQENDAVHVEEKETLQSVINMKIPRKRSNSTSHNHTEKEIYSDGSESGSENVASWTKVTNKKGGDTTTTTTTIRDVHEHERSHALKSNDDESKIGRSQKKWPHISTSNRAKSININDGKCSGGNSRNEVHIAGPISHRHGEKDTDEKLSNSNEQNIPSWKDGITIKMRSDKDEDNIANTAASLKNSKETIVTATASAQFQIEADMNVDDDNYSSRSPTDEKLRELEFQIFRKNADLLEQQKSHSKAMREQKERFEDQIQALQMRLYISETKLKNHEDALRQHMKAVGATLTSNLLTSTGTSIEHVEQTIPVRVAESESSRSYSRTSSPVSPRRKRNILYEA